MIDINQHAFFDFSDMIASYIPTTTNSRISPKMVRAVARALIIDLLLSGLAYH